LKTNSLICRSQPVHFIGIGGAGMSGIAKVLLEMGVPVSGSDLKESRYTRTLADIGADIRIGHSAANLGEAPIVVISSAIPRSNPELAAARGRGLTVLARAEMLGEICRRSPRAIAIAGTHGKTTTTSMAALILEKAGADPTFLIGGELNDIGANAKYGRGDLCIVEADESDGSLVHLTPKYAVLTNIDADHLDYHQNLAAIVSLFERWLGSLPRDAEAVVLGDGSAAELAVKAGGCRYISYGRGEDNDLFFTDDRSGRFGSEFTLHDRRLGQSFRVKLKVPGEHNILNAMAAAAVAQAAGVDLKACAEGLWSFNGVKRRFELIGETGEVTIVDDYAHHPTEVEATLRAAKTRGQRVVCVFQPHRFTRTKMLSAEFGSAFGAADMTVITDIYGAGEEPLPGVSGKLLVDKILARSPETRLTYIPSSGDVQEYLLPRLRPGDLVLTMGAGDIHHVGSELYRHLSGDPQANA
jgi:UDP-N-acetylmuramate--alanine ligase